MAHTLDRSLCSLTAIAAASLLLSTSPALAQNSQTAAPPVVQAPPAAAPAADAAPSVQPQVEAAPVTPAPVMTSSPVVQNLPPESAQADPQASPSLPASQSVRPDQSAARAKPVAKPRPAANTANRDSASRDTDSQAPSAATAPSPSPSPDRSPLARRDPAGLYTADGTPVAAAAAPVTTSQSPLTRYWPLEAGGAIILIGLIAFAATRRREDEADEAPALVETPSQAAPEPAPAPAPAPATPERPAATATVLPAGPVPTGAAREALLKRMVAAAPDEANPFITRKARMRRARMILAARKQALHEKATETFDWRSYKPSLTHVTLDSKGERAAPGEARRETVE